MVSPRTRSIAPANPATQTHDKWLTLQDAADIMTLSYFTLSRMAARGEFCPAAIKLPNGQWRVPSGELQAWIAAGCPAPPRGVEPDR
jgi:predicted DNA-binding transcriptional regulator AlpA